MKTKPSLSAFAAAALLFSAATGSAYDLTVPAHGLVFVGFPFYSRTVQNSILNPVAGTAVLRWSGSAWVTNSYCDSGWTAPSDLMETGEGFFIHNLTDSPHAYFITGTPYTGRGFKSNFPTAGVFYAISRAYGPPSPTDFLECTGNSGTSLGYEGNDGDQVLIWNGQTWDIYDRSFGEWVGPQSPMQIPLYVGFMLRPAQANSWRQGEDYSCP